VGVGTAIGSFALVTGWSGGDSRPPGQSYLLAYEYANDDLWGLRSTRVNVEYKYATEDFAPVLEPFADAPNEHEARARLYTRLPYGIGLGLSASYEKAYAPDPDQRRFGISVSYDVGIGTMSTSYERVQTEGARDDDQMLLTFRASLSDNESVRASYDSHNNRTELEYEKFRRDALGDYGLRAAIVHSDDDIAGAGELSYNANRFGVVIAHDVIAANDGGMQSQQTSITAGTQIAFAGDQVAIGRPVGRRFAIVSAHESLDDTTVGARGANTGSQDLQSEADELGPALVSAGPAYQPNQVSVEVDKLPQGYDAGPGQYDVFPGLASGYAIEVGSDASHIVRGIALNEAGEPLALLGGEIRSLDDKDAKPKLVFTNSKGRFVTEGLAPGKYQMLLGAEGKISIPLEVPKDAKGIVDVGEIRAPGGE
jgi:outer membrane usher protein FimD/PapC